ncbi:hypothetical protein [Parasitella parasitica]|uniref:Cas1p 10 TM acyl transferase domain-containing protein n=1 Tax=Parasitella parasitica TaxID=35722 RepID=A0A0B7N0N9_9FUNG|nr:hypothetical protein [Parasitella parasitica]
MAAQSNEKSKRLKSVLHGLITGLLLAILLFSMTRYLTEPQDNDRCHGMLNEGAWMTDEYKQWQPSGCMSRTYTKTEISECLTHKKIVYIGDSIMREQYYAMTHFFKKPASTPQDALHQDQSFYSEEHDITVEMWWDPYLNTTKTIDLLNGNTQEQKPSLLIMGSGVWYMRRTANAYLHLWKTAVDRVFDAALNYHVADKIMLSPVEIVEYPLLIPERKATLKLDKITLMNNYLRERITLLYRPVTPMVVPFVWNEIVTSSRNQTKDGLHFMEPVTKAQAQLALNYRCNENLKTPSFPIDTTCCYRYPVPAWYQNSIFAFFLCFVPLGFSIFYASRSYGGRMMNALRWFVPADVKPLTMLFIFGLSVIYMYLGDRTQLFGKIFKQFDSGTFTILISLMIFLGAVTLDSNHITHSEKNNDAGFLNRDQTDEWKGWMQLVILIYHFVGASRIAAIYNPVRVLVAAYLFQTGYGHFFFFYKKADFGIARVLNVMVRLNLLTCVLAYLMKTDYLFYYFSPLVSFWFSIIWITMRVMPSYNSKPWFIVFKVAIMAVLTGFIIHYPGVLEFAFDCLDTLFHIRWNVTEWRFRLSLDAWIVYVGMLCAFGTIKISEHKIGSNHQRLWLLARLTSLFFAVLGMIGFFVFEFTQSKTSYTVYHPYISWIPILSFVILRNYTRRARNSYSRFFAFVGKISLETFIGQFHMWLAADTRGLLVVLPNASWVIKSQFGWWANLLVSSIVFVFVCYHLSLATGVLTKWICSGAQEQQKKTNNLANNAATDYQIATTKSVAYKADSVPLLPTNHKTSSDRESSTSTLTIDDDAQRDPAQLQVERESEESTIDINQVWDEPYSGAQSKPSWYKSLYVSITNNYWIRSIITLVAMGVLNRFCTA